MKKFIHLAKHIVIMEDDSYLSGHPEWNEFVKEAKDALKSDTRSYKIALLKDNQDNYDKGFINTKQYEEKINQITNL